MAIFARVNTPSSAAPKGSGAQKNPEEIEKIITRIFQLQALPDTVQTVTRILSNPLSTADEVGRAIARDPSLSAQVLKLVNSGFYGFSLPITSISHSTVLLGFNVMKSMVLSCSVVNLSGSAISGLWPHSLACARLCSMIAKTLGFEDSEEFGAMGLLHDLGKVVIAEYLKPEFQEIATRVQRDNRLIVEVEREVLGVDHTDVARWLLTRWKLPETSVAPIAMHHRIQSEHPCARRAAVIHLADILIRAGGYGSGGDRRIPPLDPVALTILDVKVEDLPSLINEMMIELREFE